MSFGIRVRDENGNITLDSGFELTIERYKNVVAGSGQTVLSDIAGRRTAVFSFLLNPTYNTVPHSVELDGTTLSWGAGGGTGGFRDAVAGTSGVGLIVC